MLSIGCAVSSKDQIFTYIRIYTHYYVLNVSIAYNESLPYLPHIVPNLTTHFARMLASQLSSLLQFESWLTCFISVCCSKHELLTHHIYRRYWEVFSSAHRHTSHTNTCCSLHIEVLLVKLKTLHPED